VGTVIAALVREYRRHKTGRVMNPQIRRLKRNHSVTCRMGLAERIAVKHHGQLPSEFIGKIGVFHGNENDIQTHPEGVLLSGRENKSFFNPFLSL
jgi:hypothetical protein